LHIVDENNNEFINETAFKIIRCFDGSNTFEQAIDKLAELYKDKKENVKTIVEEFLLTLKNNYGIELIECEKKETSPVKVIGEVCYYPRAASIEITERCNLKCLHCYGTFGEGCAHEMELDDIKKILRELDDVGVKIVELTGGDVSTYKYLYDVLEYALSLKFEKIHVLTNGIILNENIINLIIDNKQRMGAQIDLHSLNDEYLYWFTGAKNTINTIKERITCLLNAGVELRIATIFTRKNLHEFWDIAEWVSVHNGKWGVGLVENLGRAILGDKDLHLTNDEVVKFDYTIAQAIEKYPNMISVIDRDLYEYNCGAISTHVVINTKGDIKLCVMDDRTYFNNEMGNCLENSIKEIYDKKIDFIYALAKYSLPDENNDECRKCEKLYACSRCLLRHLINIKQKEYKCSWYINNVPDEMKKHFFM